METQPRLSSEEWKTHVAAYEQAGMSLVAYAKQHGLCRRNLGRWRQRLRPQAAAPLALVPLRVVGTPASGEPPRLELRLRTGHALRFEGPLEPRWVATLCRALEAP